MLLKKIILQTKHLRQLEQFYKDVLQLESKELDSGGISVIAGQTELIFQSATTEDPFYHLAFNIPSVKIEEAAHWLQSKVDLLWIEEYESYIAEFDTWHARSVYFLDPSGNILEFIARHDLHDRPEEIFSSSQVRNVSEIGMVFPAGDFNGQVDGLLADHQLQYFSKQQPMPHFRAIGDDNGLFIVVPKGRNWYPTNISSGIFSLSIDFETNGMRHHLIVN